MYAVGEHTTPLKSSPVMQHFPSQASSHEGEADLCNLRHVTYILVAPFCLSLV